MKLVSVWKETANLLYWTMLAACTVGPGTVVSLTLFLTSNVILQKVFGHLLDDPFLKMGIAAGVAVSAMSILCITTSLGKELFSPIWRRRPRPSEPAAPIQQPE